MCCYATVLPSVLPFYVNARGATSLQNFLHPAPAYLGVPGQAASHQGDAVGALLQHQLVLAVLHLRQGGVSFCNNQANLNYVLYPMTVTDTLPHHVLYPYSFLFLITSTSYPTLSISCTSSLSGTLSKMPSVAMRITSPSSTLNSYWSAESGRSASTWRSPDKNVFQIIPCDHVT